MNYTYILRCRDGTLYTGWTNDMEKRLKAHNDGKGAKYTKTRRPVELVYCEEHETKQEAMQREYAIKRLTRQRKLSLIAEESAGDDAGGEKKNAFLVKNTTIQMPYEKGGKRRPGI